MNKKTAEGHLRMIGFRPHYYEEDVWIRDNERIIYQQKHVLEEYHWKTSLFSSHKNSSDKIVKFLNE